MNVIGSNVKSGLSTFKLDKSSLVVVHDDLEQKIGKYRIVQGTSFKGHNGLKSISQSLGGFKDFTRIGIGIGRPEDRDPSVVSRYVLGKIPQDEFELLKSEVFKKIMDEHIIPGNFAIHEEKRKKSK